ncbi:MAG: hypothetical protein ABGY24_13300, partial [bacterium]
MDAPSPLTSPDDIEDQKHLAMPAATRRRRAGRPSVWSLVQSRPKALLLCSQAVFVVVCFSIL